MDRDPEKPRWKDAETRPAIPSVPSKARKGKPKVDVDWAAPESFEPYEVAYPNLRWTAFYMLCTESCGGKKCLRKLVPEEDFNEHMHNYHCVCIPTYPGSSNLGCFEFCEVITSDRFLNSGYADRVEPKYVWLMGRLFLRTMLFYSENLLVAFNLADGTVADANEMELTAIVTKNASRWERKWIMPMSNIRHCFGSFVSHPAQSPPGSFNFQVELDPAQQPTVYTITYAVRPKNTMNDLNK